MTELNLDALPAPESIPKSEFGKPDHTKSRDSGIRRVTGRRTPAAKKGASAEPKDVPKGKPGQFVEPLEQIYTGLGLTLAPFDESCAATIIENGHRCAEAWDDLAQRNDTVRKALLAFVETSAFGMLLFAHAPILMAVASHHMPGRATPEHAPDEEEQLATQNGWGPREPVR